MKRTFVDTSGWLALRDDKHPAHHRVLAWFEGFRGRLVTTSDVLDETVTWAKKRWGHAKAVELGQHIMHPEEVHFVFVEEVLFEAGWELFQNRKDKGYSLTDCTSFITMERLEIKQAVTLDRHFSQQGYQVAPEQ